MLKKKKMLLVFGSMVFLFLSFGLVNAEELALKPFCYEEGFEEQKIKGSTPFYLDV